LGLHVIGLRRLNFARGDGLTRTEAAGSVQNLESPVFLSPSFGQIGVGGAKVWRINFCQNLPDFDRITWGYPY
jgi:hypothetical protein